MTTDQKNASIANEVQEILHNNNQSIQRICDEMMAVQKNPYIDNDEKEFHINILKRQYEQCCQLRIDAEELLEEIKSDIYSQFVTYMKGQQNS